MLRLISVATLLATFICLSHILAKVPEWTEAGKRASQRVMGVWSVDKRQLSAVPRRD